MSGRAVRNSHLCIELFNCLLKKSSFAGCSKMPRCKAPEILRSEAYFDVRRNDEGRGERSRLAFLSTPLMAHGHRPVPTLLLLHLRSAGFSRRRCNRSLCDWKQPDKLFQRILKDLLGCFYIRGFDLLDVTLNPEIHVLSSPNHLRIAHIFCTSQQPAIHLFRNPFQQRC